jgi:hypothetical protein
MALVRRVVELQIQVAAVAVQQAVAQVLVALESSLFVIHKLTQPQR